MFYICCSHRKHISIVIRKMGVSAPLWFSLNFRAIKARVLQRFKTDPRTWPIPVSLGPDPVEFQILGKPMTRSSEAVLEARSDTTLANTLPSVFHLWSTNLWLKVSVCSKQTSLYMCHLNMSKAWQKLPAPFPTFLTERFGDRGFDAVQQSYEHFV